MRLKATIKNDPDYKKAIIFQTKNGGTYFFLYDVEEDTSCRADYWFETLEDAKEWGEESFQILGNDWVQISDPLPGTLHDYEKSMVAVRTDNATVKIVAYDQIPPNKLPIQKQNYGESIETIDDDLRLEIEGLLRQGKPLEAIKIYRQKAKVNLAEAKHAVQNIQEDVSSHS